MDANLYLRVRKKEGRLYSDEVVAHLPSIPNDNPLANEWYARAASASRLTRYLSRKPKPLHILELGCGNGWLSNLLCQSGHHILGMDQNRYELAQAARVFLPKPNLGFCEADIFSAPFPFEMFDIIILASVIQYFPDLSKLLEVLFKYLKPNGEIHILDSPVYSDSELGVALQHSTEYYASLGFPEMAKNYFHHSNSGLKIFAPQWFYDPQPQLLRLKRWLGQIDSPFPWLMIKKPDTK